MDVVINIMSLSPDRLTSLTMFWCGVFSFSSSEVTVSEDYTSDEIHQWVIMQPLLSAGRCSTCSTLFFQCTKTFPGLQSSVLSTQHTPHMVFRVHGSGNCTFPATILLLKTWLPVSVCMIMIQMMAIFRFYFCVALALQTFLSGEWIVKKCFTTYKLVTPSEGTRISMTRGRPLL